MTDILKKLTVEGFRRNVYHTKQNAVEYATQYVSRLGHILDSWIHLSEIHNSFGALKEFFATGSLLELLPSMFVTMLCEFPILRLPNFDRISSIAQTSLESEQEYC